LEAKSLSVKTQQKASLKAYCVSEAFDKQNRVQSSRIDSPSYCGRASYPIRLYRTRFGHCSLSL